MSGSRQAGLASAIFVLASLVSDAQQADPRFGAATTVVIDVVVRDAKGRPVTDLTREDFEVLEDGVRQELGDVTRVGVSAKPHASRNSAPPPAFVALVFDRLTPEGRALARTAALTSVDIGEASDLVGVFLSGESLVSLQPYTTDRIRLRRAIDEAASGGTASAGAVVASGESARRPAHVGSAEGARSAAAAMAAGEAAWQRLSRDHEGVAALNGLRAVIEGLSVLPGRKSVVVFSEGPALPAAAMPRVDSVVATANRANVSVYTVDVAQRRAGRSDTLTALAERTGGFAVPLTSDLAPSFQRIDADRRHHYLLTYTPKNLDFAGQWRRVEVRVPSRKVEVRSRSGYLAVQALSAIPVLAYEGPALAALDRTPPPVDLPLRLGAFAFPEANGAWRAAVMVASSGLALTFAATPDGFRTDSLLMARMKDDTGEVVRKGSQPYRLTGPAADRERTQKGDVLFSWQPDLPPGRYTVEGVVHDALGPRAGVLRMPLEVPADTGLRVSSLVIVARTERLMSGELDPDNSLQVGDRLIYPNLGDVLRRRRGDTVAFYVMVRPSGPDPVEARLHVLQAGRVIAELPVPLNPPDSTGRIQQVSQVPAGGLGTGDHQFRIVIRQGSTQVTREAGFRVEIVG